MGRFRITALALSLVLIVNLPSTESAPQRQPHLPQVETEAQPGLVEVSKLFTWNFTDLSVNIKDLVVLVV